MKDAVSGLAGGSQQIPNGMLEDNYPRNMWWCAAFGNEITEKPVARWLLDLPIVLYRLADGTPVALDNRCPHRWAPLSLGKVVNDRLVCPYHGMAFGSDGKCTNIPTQDIIPNSAAVRSYPLRESGSFVWIWMGDTGAMDHEPIDMSYTTDPGWSFVNGYYEVQANWILIRENVLDLTHIPHLHSATFNQDDWDQAPEVTMEGDTIVYRQDFDPSPLSPLFCAGFGFEDGKIVKREQEGRMPSLAVSFSDWNVHDIDARPGERVDYLVRGAHVVTPAQPGRTHYFWGAAFNVPDVSEEAAKKTIAGITKAFDEDKRILEAIQAQVSADPRGLNCTEINLGADSAAIRVRQVLKKRLRAERGAA